MWEKWSLGGHKYSDMVYSDGSECGDSGPRRAVVSLECADDDSQQTCRLASVDEPATCVYHMVLACPQVCGLDMTAPEEEVFAAARVTREGCEEALQLCHGKLRDRVQTWEETAEAALSAETVSQLFKEACLDEEIGTTEN